MKRFISIVLFVTAFFVVLVGIGNLVIRAFYGYPPKAWFVLLILVISTALTWLGAYFFRKIN